jgi:uncharacterized protein (DUF1499 family)
MESVKPGLSRQAVRATALQIFGSFLLFMPLFSCVGSRPTNLGVAASRLAPCPSSPNCVSSDAQDSAHLVAAFALAMPAGDAWPAVGSSVKNLPRTRIITETSDYLHAECASAVFGFVDDLELHLRRAEGVIAVRSASRLGYSDLGVNRRRIENLHALLVRQGIVR